jgi:hypothetical protein
LASALLLVVALGAIQITTALGETATWDEPVHLTAGYSYWVTGDYEMNPEHPAFAKMLCALPLYLWLRPKLDTNDPNWTAQNYVMFANLFLYRNTVSPERMLFAARLVTITLTLMFAAYFAWWTHRRFGPSIALFALTLFAFDPNFIAHGRYVTTDLAAALFVFTTVTLWLEYLLDPKWYWLAGAGVSMGLAFASKYSTLFLAPVLLILYWWKRRRIGEFAMCSAVLAVLSVAVLAIVYWPEVRRSADLRPLGEHLTRTGSAGPALGFLADRLHMKAYGFLIGIDRLSEHDAVGHYSYLLGQVSTKGRWDYFPVAFGVKTPAAVLIALMLAVVAGRWRERRFLLAGLLFPGVAYFALVMISNINIGIRHLLPVYPFLFIVIACALVNANRKWVFAVPVLLAVESLAIYPDYLAFFNVFAGGPNAGPKYLLDSNIDWGQDAAKLGRYMRRRRIPYVCLTFFGNVDLPRVGVNNISIPPDADASKLDCVVAVSATPLYGLYTCPERFASLRLRKPTAIIGHSIYVYDLRKRSE